MKIEICVGSKCTMMGADHIIHCIEDLQETILPDMDVSEDFKLEVSLMKCKDRCKNDPEMVPVVLIDGEIMQNANSQKVMAKITEAAIQK